MTALPTSSFQMPAILTYSDISSSVATALQIYVHEKRFDMKRVAYNGLSSAVGRYIAAFLKDKGFQTLTSEYVTFSMVDHVASFVARVGIAFAMSEKNKLVKGFDSVIDDIVGDAILITLGIPDASVFASKKDGADGARR